MKKIKPILGISLAVVIILIATFAVYKLGVGIETQKTDCPIWLNVGGSCDNKSDCVNYFRENGATYADLSSLEDDDYQCYKGVCQLWVKCYE